MTSKGHEIVSEVFMNSARNDYEMGRTAKKKKVGISNKRLLFKNGEIPPFFDLQNNIFLLMFELNRLYIV
jgi:hypothetical protein